MLVESITNTTDWVGNAIRTKVYTTMVADNGKTYVEYTQYLFVPYDKRGQEVQETPKGREVDIEA